MTAPPRPPGALAGVRVIDLTRVLAGPFCTQLLADMGADVVKIEGPEGDLMRRTGTVRAGVSWYFAQFNRNKRSVVLDLYGEPGRAALADLLRSADVLVENYRPGVLAKMGFGPERIEAINPRLIVAGVNGYGSTGPYAERPSFDFIAQAMSGFMAVSGAPDGGPMRSGPPIGDLIAGLYAAFGVASALHARGSGAGAGVNADVGTDPEHGLLDASRVGERRAGVESGAERPEHVLHRAHRGADHDHVRPAGRVGRVEEIAIDDPELARPAKVGLPPARPHHLPHRAGAPQGAGEGSSDEPDPDDAQALDHAAAPPSGSGPGWRSGSAAITRIERIPGVAATRSRTSGSMGRSTSTRV